ncbi:hypothetical protein FHW36_10439 [Chitinophaga polysaccharea]|uniref:Uncharacterized protein n=1 Tax=Chitinophaga polysaccharea TaxID=1293035 RepID=A0A561PQG5_9BACT|nr:hypothetical protein FHW36_10439 [Chitinophaga polysaccharea]
MSNLFLVRPVAGILRYLLEVFGNSSMEKILFFDFFK